MSTPAASAVPPDATLVTPELPPVVPLADRTTWAKRNPSAKVQPVTEPKRKLTAAEKATRKIASAQRKESQAALNAAIAEYLQHRAEKFEEIAAEHNVKVSKIAAMVEASTHYKKERRVTLQNAIVHFMSEKINGSLAAGERKTLGELKEMALTDSDVQNMTKEDEEELIEALKEHREAKKRNARPNNKSAARDIIATMDRITDELDCLSERTGWSTFVLGSRGSVNDEATPQFHASGDAIDFFPEVLGKDPWELTRLFEQWNCKREKNLLERDTVAKMRSECCGMIKNGLRNITQVKKIEMNYANYETSIVQVYSVQLINWPLDGGVVSPSQITNTADMRKLRNALKAGECRWKQLTPAEVQAHADAIEVRRAKGEVIGKPRKQRSDAGVKRKRVDDDGDKENERQKKQKKVVQRRRGGSSKKPAAKKALGKKSETPTSREYITDSEDLDEDRPSEGESDG